MLPSVRLEASDTLPTTQPASNAQAATARIALSSYVVHHHADRPRATFTHKAVYIAGLTGAGTLLGAMVESIQDVQDSESITVGMCAAAGFAFGVCTVIAHDLTNRFFRSCR